MATKSRRVVIILIIAAMLGCLTACGSNSSPKKVAQTYFNAVKAGDLEKAIECFTPAEQAQYKSMLAISNALFGVDSGALLNGLVGTMLPDDYRNYDFKASDVNKKDSEHAEVTVDIYINGKKQDSTTAYCTKIDGKWYLEN